MPLYVPYYRPYNKHNTNIHDPGGFEPTIPISERPQTHALDRTATGIGWIRSPDRPARSESLTDYAIPAQEVELLSFLISVLDSVTGNK